MPESLSLRELPQLDRPRERLKHFGEPYQSSKGQPGRGLGLFLSVNVARTLGGRIEARNREGRGAEVTITLPLSALAPRTLPA